VAAVTRDRFEEIALLIRQGGAQLLREQEIGESDDAVERRTQLVRDVRQEQVFGLHRRVEVGVQLLQSLGGLTHLDREAPGVVMGRTPLARNREIGRRLIERGPLSGVESRAGDDA
jgi:hypothetical protein